MAQRGDDLASSRGPEKRALGGAPETSAYAPDGSPIALYARLPALGEPELIDSVVPAGSEILELGAGAGRITHALLSLGHRVVAVDESPEMLALVEGAETVVADIKELDLGRRFALVLLLSNFINEPEQETRRAYLACCARHLMPGGQVILQGFPRDWRPPSEWFEHGPVRGRLRRLEQDGRLVSGEMEYVVDGSTYLHTFSSRLLRDDELDEDLDAVGLQRCRFLDDRGAWIEATSAD